MHSNGNLRHRRKAAMTDEPLTRQIRAARSRFAAMAATYGLGVFNDSFFRQAAMLMLASGGAKHRQGWIIAVFTLPYLFFAAPAGWLADRFAKRHVVIAAKGLELAAIICGAVGVIAGNWVLITAMVFMMGLQSCLFSPALNGAIPELYPPQYVARANAVLKVVVTAMILSGIAAAGFALARTGTGWFGAPAGHWIVALGAVAIAAAGVAVSFGVPRRRAASPTASFPRGGPAETLRQLAAIRRDLLLAAVVAATVAAWFAGSLLMPLINALATDQFGGPTDVDLASYLVSAEVAGVAIGGLAGARLAAGRRWWRLIPAGMGAMAVLLILMAAAPALPAPARLPATFVVLALVGVAGGMFLVPCEAFIQVRPAADRRGTVIASVNFAVFAGILLSGPAANALIATVAPTTGMAILGAVMAAAAIGLGRALAREDKR